MKRLLFSLLAAAMLVVAVGLSRQPTPSAQGDLQVEVEERNPWTNLRLNNDPAEFRFAIVSDRTGGHRARIFSQAVEQLNLLQPEFVLSVGDLIEGYTEKPDKVAEEWKEFQGYVSKLQMPFFYVPGNHDVANDYQEKTWKEKFGRRHYSFVYRNVLFLILNTEDPPKGGGSLGEEQVEFAKKTLEQNPDVRWTIVAVHRPLWTQTNLSKNGWLEVEKALGNRPCTVFAGHIHRYQKFVRNGHNYYQLATTGGGSKVRGLTYGEFDHIAWITMKKSGPLIANIMLDGIYSEDLKKPVTPETGVSTANHKSTHPVRGEVFLDGCAVPGADVVFYLYNPDTKKYTRAADAVTEADGSFVLSTYLAGDGAPVGEYKIAVFYSTERFNPTALKPGSPIPEKFTKPETSGLSAEVKSGTNNFSFSLKK